MPGPMPKPAASRRRRNVAPTAAQIEAAPLGEIPDLPERGRRKWHPFTLAWWQSVQTCEMRDEYLASDLHGLYLLADLVDSYWRATKGKVGLAAEIRQQGQRFGLSPIDRRRLQWNIDHNAAPEETPPGVTDIDDFRRRMEQAQ